MALCIRQQDVRGPGQEGFQLRAVPGKRASGGGTEIN